MSDAVAWVCGRPEEGDPELLERLRRLAMPVTIGDAESKTVTLKLSQHR